MKNIVHKGKEVEITFHPTSGNMFGKFKDNSKAFILEFQGFGNQMKLHFLRVYNENNDLGSLALREFEKWAKSKNYCEIYGELVDGKDSSRPEKLKYFYNKNGFAVKLTDDKEVYAKISKSLV